MFLINLKFFRLLVITLVILLFSYSSYASEDLFVAKCGKCHSAGSGASVLNPADKAGTVWKRYFRRGRHPVDLSAEISKSEMKQIIQYLKDHAADSDKPAAAVIPE